MKSAGTALSQQAGRCTTLSNTRHPNVQAASPARMQGFPSQASPGFAGRSLNSLPAQRPFLASAHMPQSAEPKGRPMPASLTQQVSCSCHLPRSTSCTRGFYIFTLLTGYLRREPLQVHRAISMWGPVYHFVTHGVSLSKFLLFYSQNRQGACPAKKMQCAIATYPLASTHAGV